GDVLALALPLPAELLLRHVAERAALLLPRRGAGRRRGRPLGGLRSDAAGLDGAGDEGPALGAAPAQVRADGVASGRGGGGVRGGEGRRARLRAAQAEREVGVERRSEDEEDEEETT